MNNYGVSFFCLIRCLESEWNWCICHFEVSSGLDKLHAFRVNQLGSTLIELVASVSDDEVEIPSVEKFTALWYNWPVISVFAALLFIIFVLILALIALFLCNKSNHLHRRGKSRNQVHKGAFHSLLSPSTQKYSQLSFATSHNYQSLSLNMVFSRLVFRKWSQFFDWVWVVHHYRKNIPIILPLYMSVFIKVILRYTDWKSCQMLSVDIFSWMNQFDYILIESRAGQGSKGYEAPTIALVICAKIWPQKLHRFVWKDDFAYQ